MEIISCSLAETEQVAKEFLAKLAKTVKKLEYATVVTLSGELGAGKTAFTQAAARALGIRARVTSPTFVIMKNYLVKKGETLPEGKVSPWGWPWRRLMHIDCYRLSSGEDLLKLGWRELAASAASLIFIEWPERVGDLLAAPTSRIKFEVVGETERSIIYG